MEKENNSEFDYQARISSLEEQLSIANGLLEEFKELWHKDNLTLRDAGGGIWTLPERVDEYLSIPYLR